MPSGYPNYRKTSPHKRATDPPNKVYDEDSQPNYNETPAWHELCKLVSRAIPRHEHVNTRQIKENLGELFYARLPLQDVLDDLMASGKIETGRCVSCTAYIRVGKELARVPKVDLRNVPTIAPPVDRTYPVPDEYGERKTY